MTWKAEYRPSTTDEILLSTNQLQLEDGRKQAEAPWAYFDCSGLVHNTDMEEMETIAFILQPGTEYQYVGESRTEPKYALFEPKYALFYQDSPHSQNRFT